MTAVDEYYAKLPQPQRQTLETMRGILKGLLPQASEEISYGVPTFKVGGKGVAGLSASAKHCSYLPMSGSVLTDVADALQGYQWSKGALRFGVDQVLPTDLVELLVQTRLREIG